MWRILSGTVLLAIGGFVAGRWTKPAPAPTHAPTESSVAKTAEDAALEELLSGRKLGSTRKGVGWVARIFAGDLDALKQELAEMEAHERTALVLSVIARMDAATMQSLVEAHLADENVDALDGWVEAVGDGPVFAFVQRWAELDPEGMLAYAARRIADHPAPEEIYDNEPTSYFLALAAAMMASKFEPERAWEFANGAPGELGEELRELVASQWLISDPGRAIEVAADALGSDFFGPGIGSEEIAAALSVALDIEDFGRRDEVVGGLLSTWADSDPAAAFAAWSEMPRDGEAVQSMRLDLLFSRWAGRDPARALEAFSSLSAEQKEQNAQWVVNGWIDGDPVAALQWGKEALDPATFRRLFTARESHLSAADALSLGEGLSARDLNGAFERFAGEEPSDALAWLVEQPEDFINSMGVRGGQALGQGLALAGADDVASALERLPAGEARASVIRSALEMLAFQDAAAAQQIAGGLSGEERSVALRSMGMGWAESDPPAAADYIASQGDRDALETTLARWSAMDPSATHEWLLDRHANDPQTLAELSAAAHIGTNWAYRDPAGAATATLSLPPAAVGDQLAAVITTWVDNDPVATSAFINDQLEPGFVRDRAVSALVEQIRAGDPEGALEWASSIEGPELRERALGE